MNRLDVVVLVTAALVLITTGFWRQQRSGAIPNNEFAFRCATIALLGLEIKFGMWRAAGTFSDASPATLGFVAVLVPVIAFLVHSGYQQNERTRRDPSYRALTNAFYTQLSKSQVPVHQPPHRKPSPVHEHERDSRCLD